MLGRAPPHLLSREGPESLCDRLPACALTAEDHARCPPAPCERQSVSARRALSRSRRLLSHGKSTGALSFVSVRGSSHTGTGRGEERGCTQGGVVQGGGASGEEREHRDDEGEGGGQEFVGAARESGRGGRGRRLDGAPWVEPHDDGDDDAAMRAGKEGRQAVSDRRGKEEERARPLRTRSS